MAPRGVLWPSRGVPWPLYEEYGLEVSYYIYSLGTEVGLSQGDFVLDGDPAPPPQKGGGGPLPNF